jgi:hypothetical protein
MRRRYAVILGVLIVALAVGLEWAFRYGGSGTGCAQVVNEGIAPMEGLVVSYGGGEVPVGLLAPGEKIKVWFSGAGSGVLTIAFTQTGNPMTGFKVDDFDPAELRRDGSRLVLIVNTNQVQRFIEEEESIKTSPRMFEKILDWIREELH